MKFNALADKFSTQTRNATQWYYALHATNYPVIAWAATYRFSLVAHIRYTAEVYSNGKSIFAVRVAMGQRTSLNWFAYIEDAVICAIICKPWKVILPALPHSDGKNAFFHWLLLYAVWQHVRRVTEEYGHARPVRKHALTWASRRGIRLHPYTARQRELHTLQQLYYQPR